LRCASCLPLLTENPTNFGLRIRDVGTISSADGEPRREMTIDVGQNAPDFRLVDENEREVALPSTGGPTVLIFYRGDW
jgi:hypothetical protein